LIDDRSASTESTLLDAIGFKTLAKKRGLGEHLILGSTLDDSVGEAFDKVLIFLSSVEFSLTCGSWNL